VSPTRSHNLWRSGLALIIALAAAAMPADAQPCAPPESPATVPTRADATATTGDRSRADHHLLLLMPTDRFVDQTTAPAPPGCLTSAFVAGGLVPRSRAARRETDQPHHCIPSMSLSRALMRRHFALMPDAQFMQDSWVRYGGCAFANAGEYFDRLAQLFSQFTQPDLQALAAGGSTSAGRLRRALVESNRAIGLSLDHVAVLADRGTLHGLAICYTAQFALTPCLDPGTDDRVQVRVTTRGSVPAVTAPPRLPGSPVRNRAHAQRR
jgi:hypothetical protein